MEQTPELPHWPRRPARLATAVIEDLVDRIVGGKFAIGATLPTEPVLGETFGVSRSVLREAIKALEAMRLVKVQQGQGTTVLPLANWDVLNPVVLAAVVRHDAEWEILDHLVDVRRALESQMAMRAATRITKDELKQLFERYEQLELQIDNADGYATADISFHDTILEASGNVLGRAIVNTLTAEAYSSLRYVGEPTSHDRRTSNLAHRAIRDAVAAGEAEKAAALMDEHIREAWDRRRPTRTKEPS